MSESKGMGDLVGGLVNAAAPAIEMSGASMAGVGAYNKSLADKAAYETQATVADNNSALAQLQASDAIRRGQTAQFTSQLRTRQLQGTQAATMAANGVDLSSGSPLNILSDTEFMGNNDAGVIAMNAAKEAWGYNVQAANASNNANLLRARAETESPGRAMATSLLTSAGNVASRWYGVRHNIGGVQ